jgi:predicted regulator of Ras-like GTPase activity (Roadblock/LC7/MglB family)
LISAIRQAAFTVAALAAAAGSFLGCGSIDQKSLETHAAAIASISAEGAALAREIQQGGVQQTFIGTHTDALLKQAAQETAALMSATDSPELETRVRKLERVTAGVADTIRSLGDRPGDADELRIKLVAASREAKALSAAK